MRRRGIKQWCCLTSVAYIGHKSRIERPRKTKIGTEIAHVTWIGHHFQDQMVKGQLVGGGAYCGGLLHSTACYLLVFVWWNCVVCIQSVNLTTSNMQNISKMNVKPTNYMCNVFCRQSCLCWFFRRHTTKAPLRHVIISVHGWHDVIYKFLWHGFVASAQSHITDEHLHTQCWH